MPKIRSHRIAKDDFEYELDIDFKDAAIMENKISLDVSARKRAVNETDWQEVTVNIAFNFETGHAVVSTEGEKIGEIDLSKIDIPDHAFAEQAWDAIANAYSGSAIEDAIQAIPSDPVFGCLVKAGISTTVGQTMNCYNSTPQTSALSQRVRETILCLGQNSNWMVLTASARTVRCMVMAGLG